MMRIKLVPKISHYLIILMVYLFARMNSYFTVQAGGNEQLLLIGRIVIVTMSIFLLVRVRYIPKNITVGFVVLTGFCFFLTGAQNQSTSIDLLTNFITQMWWVSFYLVSYVYLLRISDEEKKKLIIIGVIAFYVFSLRYAVWLLSTNRLWSPGGINSIYYCLLLMPLCYLMDKKLIKYSMLFITALLTIISNKRTALISIILCGFLPPLLEKGDKKSRKKISALLLLMIVCIALVYVSEYISKFYDISILDRMMSIQEDGGSGRVVTYELVWETIKNSDLIKLLFGHGYNAVFIDRISVSSAHNDFLEVLYDYGAIGFILYVSLLFTFIKEAFRLWTSRSKYFSAYFAAMLIYITLSSISHLIIYPTYIVFLIFIIAAGFSETEVQHKIKSDKT